MPANSDHGTVEPENDRKMLRRSMLVAAGGAMTALAGCNSSTESNTPSATSTNESTPTPTRETDTPTPTADPRTEEAFQTAANHLERAFSEWQKANPFEEDSDYFQFEPDYMEDFSLDRLMSEVRQAWQAIKRGQRDEHRNRPYVATLKAAALIAEYGGKGYDAVGRTYRHFYVRHYRFYVEKRDYERAAEEARKALHAVNEISALGYFDQARDGYRSLLTAPEIDGFDLERWGETYLPFLRDFGRNQPAALKGGRTLARAMQAYVQADKLVRERTDFERAEKHITTALNRLAEAKEWLETAMDSNAVLFIYWHERLYCHTNRFDDHFELYRRGVREFEDGNPVRGDDMVKAARTGLTDSVLRCA